MRVLLVAAVAVLAVVGGPEESPFTVRDLFKSSRPDALRVLFIGNSHTFMNDLPVVFGKLVRSNEPGRELAITDVTFGGITLADHLRDGTAARVIARERWEYVVLQERRFTPAEDPAGFRASVVAFDALIRRAGAKTVLYEVPRADENPGTSHARYVDAAATAHAILVPAAVAWSRALTADSKLRLYQADGYHPTPTGTYLTACVFYTTLLHRTPEGLPPLGMVPADVAAELQRVASGSP